MDQNLRRIIRNAECAPTAENYYALVIAATRAGQVVICEDTDYDYEEALFRVSLGARSGTLYVERAFAEIGSNYSRFGWRLSYFDSLIGSEQYWEGLGWLDRVFRNIRIHLVPVRVAHFTVNALYRYIKLGIDPSDYS